jgi:hypothetical protein
MTHKFLLILETNSSLPSFFPYQQHSMAMTTTSSTAAPTAVAQPKQQHQRVSSFSSDVDWVYKKQKCHKCGKDLTPGQIRVDRNKKVYYCSVTCMTNEMKPPQEEEAK